MDLVILVLLNLAAHLFREVQVHPEVRPQNRTNQCLRSMDCHIPCLAGLPASLLDIDLRGCYIVESITHGKEEEGGLDRDVAQEEADLGPDPGEETLRRLVLGMIHIVVVVVVVVLLLHIVVVAVVVVVVVVVLVVIVLLLLVHLEGVKSH